MSNEKCYQCGGEVEVEIVGEFRDLVCQQCGIIVDSEKTVVENQDEYATEDEEDVDVME